MNLKDYKATIAPWLPLIKYNISLCESYYAIMKLQKENYKKTIEILQSHKQEISHD